MKYIIITILLFPLVTFASDKICPNFVKNKRAGDLAMSIDDFTRDGAAHIINTIYDDFTEMVKDSKTPNDIMNNPMFYLGIPNRVTKLNGYFLLQEYYIQKYKLELAVLKKENTKKLKKQFKKAQDEFCGHLSNGAVYFD